MNQEEIGQLITRYKEEQGRAYQKLAVFCKTIVPLLEDKGLPSMARELGAHLFQLETLDQDFHKQIEQNSHVFIEFLQKSFERR